MERINLHYHGQEVSQETRAHIKAQISYHMGDAPSDASVCCCISSEKEGFACNMQVHSATGHIFIHRESKDLSKLLVYVYDSMKRSFKDWKKSPERFAKKHPMAQNPCKAASHKNLPCPIHAYAHAE